MQELGIMTAPDADPEVLEMLGLESETDGYKKKYLSLRAKCEEMQLTNERLVNRLYHVKRLVKQNKRERKALMAKLDKHGDKYQEAMIPAQWDESQIYYMLSGRRPEESLSMETNTSTASSDKPPSSRPRRPPKKSHIPNKPADAFSIYCLQTQTAVVQKYYMEHNNDISDEELNKELTRQWNLLPPSDKRVYQELYKKQRESERAQACGIQERPEEAMQEEDVESQHVDIP